MQNDSKNKRIAKNTLYLYIRMAFVMLVTLYTSRVILNTLGIVDFGVYNVVAGFVSMFAFLNTSLTACIQRYYNYVGSTDGDEGFCKVYETSFLIQMILAGLVLIFVETFGLWYLNNRLVIPEDRLEAAQILFQCSTFSMILVILEVPFSAAVMAKERMDYYALVGIINIILKLLIVIFLPYAGHDSLVVYSALLLLVSIIDFLLYYFYVKVSFRRLNFRLIFHKDLFSSMLKFSGWSMFGAFAQIVRNQGLNILLNLFFGPIVNAAQGISYQVRTALSSFMANIPTAARPQLVESYAIGDYNRSRQIMFSISKVCFFLLYILVIPVIGEMNYLLHLWLGDAIPDYTVVFSNLILIITLVETLNWPLSMIIYASGKIGLYNLLTGIFGILVLPLSYLVLNEGYSPVSVYVMSLLTSIIVQYISLLCLKKATDITLSEYTKMVIWPCFVVSVLTFFLPLIVNCLMGESFLRVVVNFSVCISCTSIVIYLCGLKHNEQVFVAGYINKLKTAFQKI